MKEPERNEGEAADAQVRRPDASHGEHHLVEPKAYAFDGWSMVPLEPEST